MYYIRSMKPTLKIAFYNALGTGLYITLIACLFSVLERVFSGPDTPIITPIVMLMLFVFSALVTSGLMLGRPLMWYLDGKKKEAVALLIYTAGIFFILLLIAFTIAFLVRA